MNSTCTEHVCGNMCASCCHSSSQFFSSDMRLFKRQSYLQRKQDRLSTGSPTKRSELSVQASSQSFAWNFIQDSTMSGKFPLTWAIFHCFSGALMRASWEAEQPGLLYTSCSGVSPITKHLTLAVNSCSGIFFFFFTENLLSQLNSKNNHRSITNHIKIWTHPHVQK